MQRVNRANAAQAQLAAAMNDQIAASKARIRGYRDEMNDRINVPDRHCRIGWVRLKGLG